MSTRARRLPGAQVEPFPWKSANGAAAAHSMRGYEPAAQRGAAAPAQPAAVDIAAVERDAFIKGYAQGERAGDEAAARRGEAMLRRLAATVEEVAALRKDLLKRAEHDLVRLALALAERIVRREIGLDRDLLVTMARVAIDRVGPGTVATIKLNPADYAQLTASQTLDTGAVQVLADQSVSRGGCIVQTEVGLIDIGIEAQIAELSQALLVDALHEPQPQPQSGIDAVGFGR